ncbi:MAG: hypothetical protein ACLGH6_03820 [Gammaproteobacteria bacterium]
MNRQQTVVCPRLHMGCGESLHSQLLLGEPRPLVRETAGKARRAAGKVKTLRSRTRG